MSEELVEETGSTMDSGGTYGFEADGAIAQDDAWQKHKRAERLETDKRAVEVVLKGQNHMIETIADSLDAVFPPEEFGKGYGTGYISPGELVRQYKVDVAGMLQAMDEEAAARG